MNILNLEGFKTRELWGTRQTEYPLKESPTHKKITCHYMGSFKTYNRLALSSVWEENPEFFLVDEQIEKQEGDLVYFYRVWMNMPANFKTPQSFAFRFPGLDGVRGPFTLTICAKVLCDFFHTSDPFSTENGIPLLNQLQFKDGDGKETDTLSDSSSPSKALYMSMITGKNVINIEGSSLENYSGNIWLRKTTVTEAF